MVLLSIYLFIRTIPSKTITGILKLILFKANAEKPFPVAISILKVLNIGM